MRAAQASECVRMMPTADRPAKGLRWDKIGVNFLLSAAAGRHCTGKGGSGSHETRCPLSPTLVLVQLLSCAVLLTLKATIQIMNELNHEDTKLRCLREVRRLSHVSQ